MQSFSFKPFKATPKQINSTQGQFEYIKVRHFEKMNIQMCEIFDVLNKQIWCIRQRKYPLEQYRLVINMIVECEAISIYLDCQHSSQFLRLIAIPRFNNLRQLLLDHNNIDNIECLQFLDAPLLSILTLDWNNLTQLQAFKKTKFNQLQYVSICYNKINSSEELKVFGRCVLKQTSGLIDLQNYIYFEQQYTQFVFMAGHYQFSDNHEILLLSKNQYLRPPDFQQVSEKRKIAKTPFLAKTWLPNQPKQRPKIDY